MRVNEPVTDVENHFGEGTILVSKTDKNGKIIYCNRDFIEISGFSETELIGQPHNLVRHPDMPPAAFKDLWATLKRDDPWSGIVKNRCKDGGYYWVYANVSPIMQGGRVESYMSVRTKPTRKQVEDAEELYRALNSGKASLEPGFFKRMQLKVGKIKSTSWLYATVFAAIALQALIAFMVTTSVSSETIFSTLGAGAIATLVMGIWLTRRISVPMRTIADKLTQLSEGNYFDWIEISRGDEFGAFMRAIKMTQVRLGFDVMDARETATSAGRVKQALDNVNANVMMADADNNIIYVNDSLVDMFSNAQNDIRKDLPNFDVTKLVGVNIDVFHKNPAHQQHIVMNMTDRMEAGFVVGGRTMRFLANPIVDVKGQRQGTVVEWEDRTEEVKIEKEIAEIVAAAQVGELDQRVELEGKQGFFLNLSEGVNGILDTLSRAFSDINSVMTRVADGKLDSTIEADYSGEFGEAKGSINSTIENLAELVVEIRGSADTIQNGANEILSGNNNLSARTEQQASGLEETASSMEELAGTVRNNADNARQADQLAQSAREQAEKGGSVVSDAITAMKEINTSSEKIAEIIGVIDEIAFQTNLLSLNASVEAARAGEQGRGFAVVATEVRNLAQRSATAAKEIKELIQDSGNKVQTGSRLVNESGETLQEIVVGVKKVGDIISEIAAAGLEQTQGIDQVNQAVSHMDEVTQQNAALAEETSAASVSMNKRAAEMVKLIEFFSVSDEKEAAYRNSATTSHVPAQRANSTQQSSVTSAAMETHGTSVQASDDGDTWQEF